MILPSKDVSLCTTGKRSSSSALKVLILDAIVSLINTCNEKQLLRIPEELSKPTLSYLKASWVEMRNQGLELVADNCSSVGKMEDLLESVFRLSINYRCFTTTGVDDNIKRSIFGPNQSDFDDFIFNYWENSPVILRNFLGPMDNCHHTLTSFVQSFKSEQIHDILLTLLDGLVCCPPLPSDELDILNFLKEVKDQLGHHIILGQDIRVVKTVEEILGNNQGKLKREVHFLKGCNPDLCDIGDVWECEKAYQEGYTIAMRGMEFRSQNIASIADKLAGLFGQPSVGANAYLTPPGSQGLARHYDDHCVFVCQLLGKKQWKVFPRYTSHLPRLYEPLNSVIGSEGENLESECNQFLLGEGDILYIPRGCLHEACTVFDEGESIMDDASTGFSLHLTLGIEIEPPFEWEGFAHVGLHIWSQKKKPLHTLCSSSQRTMYMSTSLLHVAIHQIGVIDPIFVKACLVSTCFSTSHVPDNYQSIMYQSQRTIFRYVINRIKRDAGFLDALECVKVAVKGKNEDMFQRLRWLRQLSSEEDAKGVDWGNPLTEFEKLLQLLDEHKLDAESEFLQIKSRFCGEVVLEDVCESFMTLLHKYKRARTQYMNGMLSLNRNAKIS